MSKKIPQGLFVVIEGCDRMGKTSGTLALVKSLQELGYAAEYHRSPDYTTPTGALIQKFLKEEVVMSEIVAQMVFSANRCEKSDQISGLVNDERIVVMDRYVYSARAYCQASGLLCNSDVKLLSALEIGLLRPDLGILLDTDLDKVKDRGDFVRERYDKDDVQKTVRAHYLKEVEGGNLVLVDAGMPQDQVQKRCLEMVLEKIREIEEMCEGGPIVTLNERIRWNDAECNERPTKRMVLRKDTDEKTQ